MLFTGRPDGRGHSCGGDSGAPLFRTEYDESGRMRKVLVGINHGASGRCGTFPTIFARVEDPSILNYIMGPRGDYCLNKLSFLSWFFFRGKLQGKSYLSSRCRFCIFCPFSGLSIDEIPFVFSCTPFREKKDKITSPNSGNFSYRGTDKLC